MPEGQFSGPRQNYIYESDSGERFVITTDETLGDIDTNGLEVATTANGAALSAEPKRFSPRVVFWQGELNERVVRKEIICGTVTSDLYSSDVSQALTVDGVVGSTTGRRGEKLSFRRLVDAGDGTPGGEDGGDVVAN